MPPRVLVLGGGPAGCGAAWRLAARGNARVTLLEQSGAVGGHAGSFLFAGQRVDYGSHRLHPACDPAVLADLRSLLGDDLRRRARHGRIRLRGRWLHFPLRPLDLLLRLDRAFALGALVDMLRRRRGPDAASGSSASFASVLLAQLGPTICHSFYFPYARKIWGLEPTEIDAEQARRRVSARTFRALFARLARPSSRGVFFYPRLGYGQICEALAAAARDRAADLRLGRRVVSLRAPRDAAEPWVAEATGEGGPTERVEAELVFSTLPLTRVAAMIDPAPPAAILRAADALTYRSLLLVYLALPVDRFTPFDAHYFPEREFTISRLSEPKNYSGEREPAGSTVLCAEIPCRPEDPLWSLEDRELAAVVVADLERAGLAPPAAVAEATCRRLRHAYPVYRVGFAAPLAELDAWLSALPRFVSYGRQGLYAHDNAHHALVEAYRAADCVDHGGFDAARWLSHRQEFASHVVED
ncbi:MAG TPA: FAD-dependent oxidoreductase [Thermoanaerobaculia bacterium]|nr:FAD-dependent oxidoreductase [Thermoanaerobaculia bacterium]